MKTKEPTQQNHIDIFYRLLLSYEYNPTCDLESLCNKFYVNPGETTEFFDNAVLYYRETLPEIYEYYVSSFGMQHIKIGHTPMFSKYKTLHYEHKIKITICED